MISEPDVLQTQQIKHAINEIVTRDCRGVDRNDWELVRSCYHADAIDNHAGAFTGTPDEYVAWASVATQRNVMMNHCAMNHSVRVESPVRAASELYALCFHRSHAEDGSLVDRTVMCRYLDWFEYRDDRWLIADRVVVIDWSRVEPVTAEDKFRSGAAVGTRDDDDPSFSLFPKGFAALPRLMAGNGIE